MKGLNEEYNLQQKENKNKDEIDTIEQEIYKEFSTLEQEGLISLINDKGVQYIKLN